MLPGVESEPVNFREAFSKGGKLMFIVLGLLVSFDALTLNVVQTVEPELIHTFHISQGTAVFISTSSGLFYALGAIPLGWLADRMRRVPIVGVTSILGAAFTFVTGAAIGSFMLFWTLCFTGITKANAIAVHPSLIADAYPIGIRARMSAVLNLGQQILGNFSPLLVGVIATSPAAPRVGAGPCTCSASRCRSSRHRVLHEGTPAGPVRKRPRAPRSGRGREPGAPSMEAAFTRLKKIATIRTVIAAFCALGFGLFAPAAWSRCTSTTRCTCTTCSTAASS